MSCMEVSENTSNFSDVRVVVQTVPDLFSGGEDLNFSSSLSSPEYDDLDCLSPEHPEPSELGDHERIIIGRGDEDDDIDIDIETVDTDNMADRIRSETIINTDDEEEYGSQNQAKLTKPAILVTRTTVSVTSSSSLVTSPVTVRASPKILSGSTNLSENVKILNSYEVPAPQTSKIEAESLHDLLYQFETEYFTDPTDNITGNVTNDEMKEADWNPAFGVELDADLNLDTAETLDYSEGGILNLNSAAQDLESVVLYDNSAVIEEEVVSVDINNSVSNNKSNFKSDDHDYGQIKPIPQIVPKITCLPALPKKVSVPVKMTSLLKPRHQAPATITTTNSVPSPSTSTAVQANLGRQALTYGQRTPAIKVEAKTATGNTLDKLPGYMTTLGGRFKKMEDNTKNLVPREAMANVHHVPPGSRSPLRLDAEDNLYTRLPSYCDEISQSKRYGVSNEDEEAPSYNPAQAKHKPSEKPGTSHKHKHGSRKRRHRDNSPETSESDSAHRSSVKSRLKHRQKSKRKHSRDSRSRSSTKKRRRRSPSYSTDSSSYSMRDHEIDLKTKAHEKAVKERRVVYVGGIQRGWTPHQLRQRLNVFGDIETCTVHFRETGDNYGFVTFEKTREAFEAVEGGNQVLGPSYTLCFGGRRKFCKTDYADLDGCTAVKEEWAINEGVGSYDSPTDDFERLLKNTLKKLKR